MTDVHKGLTLQGDLVAFWKSEENTISFFMPSNYRNQHFSHSMASWNSDRASYISKDNDFDLYDDTINAAWHYLGQRLVFLNKRSVALSTVPPGVYYPRIWRGYSPASAQFGSYNAIVAREQYGYSYTQSVVATASLFDQLVEIFRYVEPSAANYQTYGHKMRELLLLTCTEIETQWRALLEENTRKENWRDRYSTVDYVRLKEPLRLDDWSVSLTDYGHLGEFTPFARWSDTAPTKTLTWYDAYNAVKHHREAAFSKATLEAVLNASAALHIMQMAQWGPEVFDLLHENRFSPFTAAVAPVISLAEIYMPSLDETRSLSQSLYFEK
jgi:hypothetical protein